MKKFLLLIISAFILFFISSNSASASELNFFAGYNYSMGKYISNLNSAFPDKVNSHGYSTGLEVWGGKEIEIGFVMGFIDIYRFSEKLNTLKSGGGWIESPLETHNFVLNYRIIPLMFGVKFNLPMNFYIGASTGYQLSVSKPKVDDKVYSEYGDDGLISMLMAGYNINISGKVFMSISMRTYLGFSADFVYTSFSPTIAVSYKL